MRAAGGCVGFCRLGSAHAGPTGQCGQSLGVLGPVPPIAARAVSRYRYSPPHNGLRVTGYRCSIVAASRSNSAELRRYNTT